MTPSEIDAVVSKHLDGWLNSTENGPCLRIRMADAIREAVKLRDQQWADGNATLRHERDDALAAMRDARYEARHLRQDFDDLHLQIDENGVTGQKDGSIQAKINAVCQERDTLAAWKDSALAVERSWDCQAVGKLLGIPLGSDIRAGIEPGIVALIAERDADAKRLNLLQRHKYDLIFNPHIPQWIIGNGSHRTGLGTDDVRKALDVCLSK